LVEVDGTTFEDFRERQIGQRLRKVLRALADPTIDSALMGAMHLAWLPIREKGRLVAIEFATLRRALSGKASDDILFRHRLELLENTLSRTPMDRLKGFAQALLAHQDQRIYQAGTDLDPAFLELRKALTGRNANLTLGSPEFLRASLAALFDVQALNEGFFQDLNQRFREDLLLPLLAQARSKKVPGDQARGHALDLLMRLLFLRFLEAKGWILGDSHWLLKQDLKKVKDAYQEVLAPLFQALALPRSKRPKGLPDVPYLNGGLFEVDSLGLGGMTLDPRNLEKFRTFLYQHAFTLEESSPLDQRVAIDPEMLGRVFETLVLAMEEAEQSGTDLEEALEKGVGKGKSRRKITGSYYTPRVIVQYLCRETLDAHLSEATGEPASLWAELRQKALDSTFELTERLPRPRLRRIEDALSQVRACDPAVGSGAFLIGMMQELLLLRMGLAEVEGVHVDQSGIRIAEWKRNIITRNLYGVDLNKEAVEICRLRLWLSLVIDAKDDEPLPSLDFRILCGDSLVDRLGEETFPDSLGGVHKQAWAARTERLEEAHREAEVTKELKSAFAEETDPETRRNLRQQIIAHSQRAHQAELDAMLEDLVSRRATLERELRLSSFREEKKLKKALEQVKAQEAWMIRCLDQLQRDGYLKKPFLWKLAFPEVFEKGGFDLVVGNPPYVRQEFLDGIDQEAYVHAFPMVACGTADLLTYFMERGHQVLKRHGHLGFITSNKYMRAAYGANLRTRFPKAFAIRQVIDFGDLPVFDVAAYPSLFIAQKEGDFSLATVADLNAPIQRHIQQIAGRTVSLASVREALDGLGEFIYKEGVHDFDPTFFKPAGWVLENTSVLALLAKLLTLPGSQPLGSFAAGRMYRGLVTGLNEAFVINNETRLDLIRKDSKSKELIKPWLRGKDVKRWKSNGEELFLIAIQNSGDSDCTHSWKSINGNKEKEAEAQFKRSYPAIWEHVKHFEKQLRPRADQGRFWWELRPCAYYQEFDGPKLIWPDIAKSMRFCWDSKGSFLGNTAYFGALPKWSGAILNSTLIEFILRQLTNSIHGGFVRLFT
jgi:hypothetical protein